MAFSSSDGKSSRVGYRSTRFFHAAQRKRMNCIEGLLDENGVWCSDLQTMADIVNNYF